MYLEKLFWEGHNALELEKYERAILCFNKIIVDKNANKFIYLSGSYVNLAQAKFSKAVLNNQHKQKSTIQMVENYIEKALQIKPSNQAALTLLLTIYTVIEEFEKAIECFVKLKNDSDKNRTIEYFSAMNTYILQKNEKVLAIIPSIEKLYNSFSNHPFIVLMMSNSFFAIEEYTKSYFVLRKYLDNVNSAQKTNNISCITMYDRLTYICASNLQKPKEAIEYANEGLAIFNKMPSHMQENYISLKRTIVTNLGMAYIFCHDYTKAIQILENQVINHPNNTDFYNLAYYYLRIKDYKSSLLYCHKALYTSIDEQALYILAENYFHQGNLNEALKYYKKAISLLLDEKNIVRNFIDDNNKNITSISYNTDKTTRDTYISLVQCYISMEDYINANAVITLMQQQWPHDDEVNRISLSINKFIVKEELYTTNLKAIDQLSNELNDQKEKFKKEISEVRQWALKLIKVQDHHLSNINAESIDETEWQVIMDQMHTIALEMRESSSVKSFSFHSIKSKLAKSFPKLSKKALNFLATGEYLYLIHKDSHIDFAPILIEYSKVIEFELNRIFQEDYALGRSRTLGQLHRHVVTTKFKKISGLSNFLEILVYHRNGSAHSGVSTKEKVEKIREMIYEEKWLEKILVNA